MYSKALIALAAACFVGQTVAAGPHRHGLQHARQKRALVTEVVTVTDWVTVTVTDGEPNTSDKAFYTNSRKLRPSKAKPQSTTSLLSAPPSPSSTVPTTTIISQVTSTTSVVEQSTPSLAAVASSSSEPQVENVPATTPISSPSAPSSGAQVSQSPTVAVAVAVPSSSSSAAASAPASVSTGSSGSTGGVGKRGLAYNNAALLSRFLSTGSKISWTYNWGQYDDSGTSLEFCPMMWGLKLDFAETWPGNAQKAIDAGSRCLFSFNEPDLDSQANMPAATAASKHMELMNPFTGKARIGSPAITNSGDPNQGVGWLSQFFDACKGNCTVDFIPIHIYGVDTNTFLAHTLNVYNTFKKPVWITEFAFTGSDDEINSQLETVIDQIETNSTFSFVERYSYFMVTDGSLVKGNSISTYGNTFAYGA
ncbi:glycosyl hydrolase catalytic core-domain-containing protein [Achaetomium macrosporum]|uniref:Glycosyl hydrolase catalytic core-domain-containing protein n=1 Tax=Achaetomium macrosporum TaxID=79813 RepID=A0AAN7CG62_9PEZI|nr:glycosyl hydrolase catalytic core-domain-containing protein [Achaetomium macrosporum]